MAILISMRFIIGIYRKQTKKAASDAADEEIKYLLSCLLFHRDRAKSTPIAALNYGRKAPLATACGALELPRIND